MAKVDHVTARFGGEQRVFRFPRSPGGVVHHAPMTDGFSAYACYQRLAAGVWTFHDVLRVLSPLPPGQMIFVPDPSIVAVIEAGGPGTYAPLAARILEAALFGVSAPASRWDERNPFAVLKAPGEVEKA